jgi:hypothetical protein
VPHPRFVRVGLFNALLKSADERVSRILKTALQKHKLRSINQMKSYYNFCGAILVIEVFFADMFLTCSAPERRLLDTGGERDRNCGGKRAASCERLPSTGVNDGSAITVDRRVR